MDKRAQSSGIGWFFAIIVIGIILFLFYLVAKGIFLPVKQVSPEISISNFNEINSIHDYSFFEEYYQSNVFNSFSYSVYEQDTGVLTNVLGLAVSKFKSEKYYRGNEPIQDYFFGFLKDVYGINQDNYNKILGCYSLKLGNKYLFVSNKTFNELVSVDSNNIPAILNSDPQNGTILLKNKDSDSFRVIGVNLGGCND